MPAICGRCHGPVVPDARWCPHCGASFGGTEALKQDVFKRLAGEGLNRIAIERRRHRIKYLKSILAFDDERNPVLQRIMPIIHVVLVPIKVICLSICFLLWDWFGWFDDMAIDYFLDFPSGHAKRRPFLRSVAGALEMRFGYRPTYQISCVLMYVIPVAICLSLGMANSVFRQYVYMLIGRSMRLFGYGSS